MSPGDHIPIFIVDDTDETRMSYDNSRRSWVKSQDEEGRNFGGFSHSTHNVTGHSQPQSAEVSLSFHGTRAEVYGTIRRSTTSAAVTCTIDSQQQNTFIGDQSLIKVEPLFHKRLCGSSELDQGDHNLSVTLLTDDIALDYVLYWDPDYFSSSLGSSLAQLQDTQSPPLVLVDDSDISQLEYSRGWFVREGNGELNTTSHLTNQPNATVSLKFQGKMHC
jgi:hypothetical protein